MHISLKVVGFLCTALIIFLLFLIGMFFYKGWFEETFIIYAKFSSIKNLNKGIDVKTQSIKIGKVKDFMLADDGSTIIVAMEIWTRYRELIRENSRVSFMYKMSLQSGDIEISPSSKGNRILNQGDTLYGISPLDVGNLLSQVEHIANKLDSIVTRLNRGEGTAGILLNDRAIADRTTDLLEGTDQIIKQGGVILGDIKKVTSGTITLIDSAKAVMSTVNHVSDQLPPLVDSGNKLIQNTNALINSLNKITDRVPIMVNQGENVLDNANDMFQGARRNIFLGGLFMPNVEDPILILE